MLSYNIRNISATLILAFGLIYYANLTLFLYAVLLQYVLFNCVTVAIHEGWVHKYIIPKNRVIGFLIDYISYIIFNTSKIRWQYLHTHHHRYWKTNKDWDQYGVDNTPWYLYVFFLYRNVPPKHAIEPFNDIEEFSFQKYNQLFCESQFLEKYFDQIVIFTHLTVMFLIGLELYFYFLFFQVCVFMRLFKLFSEVIPHRNKKTIGEESDATHVFLLCTSLAYHTSHHLEVGTIHLGKGYLKYLNVQYYFSKFFFKMHAKID
jgi:fatty-acid desaturase